MNSETQRTSLNILLCGCLVVTTLLVAIPGCLFAPRATLPGNEPFLRDRLVVSSDVELDDRDELVQELVSLRSQMSRALQLRESFEPVYVHLFARERQFRAFAKEKYPELQKRRAFFVGNAAGLSVYARWSDRVREDLRHEVAHGYLHAVAPAIPIWLDEGLAEYFEIPSSEGGVNRQHADLLLAEHRAASWSPNVHRLEGIVVPSKMIQTDYAEAWLWVHFLLRTTPERRDLLLKAIAELQTGGSMSSLAPWLAPMQPELLVHLQRVASRE